MIYKSVISCLSYVMNISDQLLIFIYSCLSTQKTLTSFYSQTIMTPPLN